MAEAPTHNAPAVPAGAHQATIIEHYIAESDGAEYRRQRRFRRGRYHDIMQQLTLRVDGDLAAALKRAAAARSQSVNSFATTVLNAAIDPTFASDEAAELRERLDRAGLLAHPSPADRRPSERALARARKQAGKGRPLASFIAEDRR